MIVFVSYSGALGGAERLLVDYATALPGERCLACPEGALAVAARAAGVRVLPLRERSLVLRGRHRDPVLATVRLAAHARELGVLARDLDPDLVIAWGMRSAIAAMLARVRFVFQHNDLVPGPLVARLVGMAADRAQQVVALSETIAGQLGRDAVVIHPGIDIDAWATVPDPVTPPEIVVLGALVAWKSPQLALAAVALARVKRPELRLRFVGEPLAGDTTVLDALRERASLPDLAGAVEFAGFVADPRLALSRATCLLHCAPCEPFGMAVLEALAAGRPAVVPAAGGPAEIVDESCGVLYPPGDAVAAAAALVTVTGDPPAAAALGVRGRERARTRFAADRSRARFTRLIEQAARAAPTAAHGPAAELAIVTVTHNSGPWLDALLASVQRHLPGVHTIVVDCASVDDSVAVARARTAVTSIALEENVGFGAASNRGLQAVTEPITVLLNPDVELLDGSLRGLATEALGGPDRLLAPRVLAGDGTREDNVHPVPASLADLVSALVPSRLVSGTASAPWGSAKPRRVGWAVGCAVLARTETLRRLGPFDERIFLYGEDLDLGLRAAAAGVETWFSPSSRVLHHRAHSTQVAFGGEAFARLARARRDVVRARLGTGRGRIDDGTQALTFAVRALAKPLLGRPAARERAQLAALRRVRRTDGRS